MSTTIQSLDALASTPPVLLAPLAPSQAALAAAGDVALASVIHIINGEHFAGAERVQDLLAQGLRPLGYDVNFVCLKRGSFARERVSHSPLYQYNMAGRFDIRPALAVARLAQARGARIIHTHTPRAALIGRLAASWTGASLVHHVHSPTTRDSTHPRRDAMNAAIEGWAMRAADAVVTVSDSLVPYAIEQGVERSRIVVSANGVPTLGPLPERTPPEGRWTLGCVALFRPRKGIESLLEALALLVGDGHDVALRAVGAFETTGYAIEVRRLVAQLGLEDRVTWTGFSSDVPSELRRMDLFVLPSLFGEGMPMVALEAMAAGAPVVATRVEGIPQAIRDGLDGLLAEPARPQDLKRQLLRLIDGEIDWSRLRESAHRRQATHFSDAAMAERMAALYKKLLSGEPVAPTSGNAKPRRARLFGIDIDAVRMPQAVDRLLGWIRQPGLICHFVVTPNLDHVVMYQHHAGLRTAYEHASLVLADGMPVVVAARLLRRPIKERVAGSDLVPALFDRANRTGGLRVFLLGAGPGVAERAGRNIEARWRQITVMGTDCPPLGFELDPARNERILAAIEHARPDVLVVGLGAPKQELWVDAHRERIRASVALCAGASIDFLAGEKRRAPKWMRSVGLEWLHRLASEPRRLAGRYARDAWSLPSLMWSELARGTQR